jgi:hypothetical protein
MAVDELPELSAVPPVFVAVSLLQAAKKNIEAIKAVQDLIIDFMVSGLIITNYYSSLYMIRMPEVSRHP